MIELVSYLYLKISWCGPCLRIAPKIEDWSTGEFKDTVAFFKVDVDQAEAVSQEYNVEAMPTFIFFKDGKEVHRVVGANVNQLKADIESKSK
jgi:thioredoxin 1